MNNVIIQEFEKLIKYVKQERDNSPNRNEKIKHTFRLDQLIKALNIIKNYPNEITSSYQLENTKGIGKGTLQRIDEILKTGKLKEIKKGNDIQKYIENLEKIIGIGPSKAKMFVEDYNIRTVNQLKKAHQNNKIQLSDIIIMGLKYHNKYKQNIPRKEIDIINEYLKKIAIKVDPELNIIITGSYRRMLPKSNDIDILLTHPNIRTQKDLDNPKNKNYLNEFINILKKDKFIKDTLVMDNVKFMGFSKYKTKPIRRLDIRYVPSNSYYTALLYFTGSGHFNRLMRREFMKKKYKLNEYGLFKLVNNKFKKIKIKSEKDVFDKLNIIYLLPHERTKTLTEFEQLSTT